METDKRGRTVILEVLNAAAGMNLYEDVLGVMFDSYVAFLEPYHGSDGIGVYAIERDLVWQCHDSDEDAPPPRIGIYGVIYAGDDTERWVHML